MMINGVYRPVSGSFGNDRTDDVFWYAPGSAADYLHDFPVRGGTAASIRYTLNGGTYLPFSADVFGDGPGAEDIFWYAPGLPADGLWDFFFGPIHKIAESVKGDYVTAAGDFFGDGADDLVFENDAELILYEHRQTEEGVDRHTWWFLTTLASADARTTAEAGGGSSALPSGPAEQTSESTIVRP